MHNKWDMTYPSFPTFPWDKEENEYMRWLFWGHQKTMYNATVAWTSFPHLSLQWRGSNNGTVLRARENNPWYHCDTLPFPTFPCIEKVVPEVWDGSQLGRVERDRLLQGHVQRKVEVVLEVASHAPQRRHHRDLKWRERINTRHCSLYTFLHGCTKHWKN